MAGTFHDDLWARLPELSPWDVLQLTEGDTVIHAPGFEDRSLAVGDRVRGTAGTSAILLDYVPANPDNRLTAVRRGLAQSGVAVAADDILTYSRFDPRDFEAQLRDRLLYHKSRRAVIDISTMSKLAIMLVLHVCYDLNLAIKVLYTEAQEYGPTEEQFRIARERGEIHRPSLQVFTGVHRVVQVKSLASVAMQGQPTAALVFMSFNDALTQVLLNTVYPGRLLLINGRPPQHRWREAATAWIHDEVRREWDEDNPVQEGMNGEVPLPLRAVSTLDYRETVDLLLGLYWRLSANHRVLLAPAGSKLQAVGCFVVKALHPDIHIEYPSPEGFAQYYSVGIGARWLLDLGNVAELLVEIGALERREYLEMPTEWR